MKQLYRLVYIALLGCFALTAAAQDGRRYLMVSLSNETLDTDHGDRINWFANNGGNAVLIPMLWSTINNWQKDAPNPWQQYDNQIAIARRRGMKIAIRLWIDNQRSDIPSDPNNNLEDGYNGWNAEDRMQGFNSQGQNLKVYQQYGGNLRGTGTFRVFTSYAAQSTLDKGTSFATRVAQRYGYLLATGELLFISVGTTGQAELGYPGSTTKGADPNDSRLFDYSEPTVRGYRTWLSAKYGGSINRLREAWGADAHTLTTFNQIQPKAPNGSFEGAFTGAAGQDWYRYRYSIMKAFMYDVAAAIKAVDNRFRVIHEYGSVYDRGSTQRGSFSFKDLGESLDGIKINDGNYSDYRFSTDLIRSNSPGKLLVNEVEGNVNRGFGGEPNRRPILREYLLQQFVECFEHGTTIVCAFNFDMTNEVDVSVLREVSARYITNTHPILVNPTQTAAYTISGILADGGCNTDRTNYSRDCQAYNLWRLAYEQGGGKPVNFLAQDDILSTPDPEIAQYSRVLVLGNALTENGPDPGIGWTGGPWGMAATSRDRDYVSLLTQKLADQNPGVSVLRLRLDDWERTYASGTYPYRTAVTDRIGAFWPGNKPDLVIVSLSENISQTTFDAAALRNELIKLVVSTGFTTGIVVLRNSFLPARNQSNTVMRQVANETGWRFVNLSCVRGDPALTAAADWPTADSLVKRYPGNAGMEAIANLYCTQIPGLNCYGQLGPVPTISRIRVNFGADSCQVCSDRCRGGIIQGSQDSTRWTTLALLRQPARGWNNYLVNASQPWRYVRYVAAKDCYGELTELELYAGNRKVRGLPIGSGTGYQAALDGNLNTVWRSNTPGPQNTVGLDFGVGAPPESPLSVWCPEEQEGAGQLEVAPNPADDFVTYLYLMPTTASVALEVFDLTGRRMHQQQLPGSEVRQQYRMYVGTWQPGMYIVKVKAGQYTTTKRFLIAR